MTAYAVTQYNISLLDHILLNYKYTIFVSEFRQLNMDNLVQYYHKFLIKRLVEYGYNRDLISITDLRKDIKDNFIWGLAMGCFHALVSVMLNLKPRGIPKPKPKPILIGFPYLEKLSKYWVFEWLVLVFSILVSFRGNQRNVFFFQIIKKRQILTTFLNPEN
jgi:hypothetical protein